MEARKRGAAEAACEGSSDDDVGPSLPPPSAPPKKKDRKRRRLEHEQAYLAALPCAENYEQSFMHRDVVTHVIVTPRTNFILTASADGHVKFWRKWTKGIEFVKHFLSHLGSVEGLCASADGLLAASTGSDRALKFYDVAGFDMINMLSLEYAPTACAWVHGAGSPEAVCVVADASSSVLRAYSADATSAAVPLRTFDVHASAVTHIAHVPALSLCVSVDGSGMIEYWNAEGAGAFSTETGAKVSFASKLETDLYDLASAGASACGLCVTLDGRRFALSCTDGFLRVFDLGTGKLRKRIDARPAADAGAAADGLDGARRLAVEEDLRGAADTFRRCNCVFDRSGHFLLYGSAIGVKVVNLKSNTAAAVLGGRDGAERFTALALFQGAAEVDLQMALQRRMGGGAEAEGAEEDGGEDPTLFACSFRRRRFYLLSRREPGQALLDGTRDVLNERPSHAERRLAEAAGLPQRAVLRTTKGDVTLKLYGAQTPKAVENFCGLAGMGYYDGTLFHRVVRGFMLQGGDPEGDGTGGTSIWGEDFEDELRPGLDHAKPFTLSMANRGPNTNGSQFFITTAPAPWLDGKHTVFGAVLEGHDVVRAIEAVQVDRSDKPLADVKILNIDLK